MRIRLSKQIVLLSKFYLIISGFLFFIFCFQFLFLIKLWTKIVLTNYRKRPICGTKRQNSVRIDESQKSEMTYQIQKKKSTFWTCINVVRFASLCRIKFHIGKGAIIFNCNINRNSKRKVNIVRSLDHFKNKYEF